MTVDNLFGTNHLTLDEILRQGCTILEGDLAYALKDAQGTIATLHGDVDTLKRQLKAAQYYELSDTGYEVQLRKYHEALGEFEVLTASTLRMLLEDAVLDIETLLSGRKQVDAEVVAKKQEIDRLKVYIAEQGKDNDRLRTAHTEIYLLGSGAALDRDRLQQVVERLHVELATLKNTVDRVAEVRDDFAGLLDTDQYSVNPGVLAEVVKELNRALGPLGPTASEAPSQHAKLTQLAQRVAGPDYSVRVETNGLLGNFAHATKIHRAGNKEVSEYIALVSGPKCAEALEASLKAILGEL